MITNPQIDEDELSVETVTAPPPFRATVPVDLMEKLSKRDQHTLETMSVMAQNVDWNITLSILHNKVLRKQERRIIKMEKRLAILTGKWSPLLYVGGIILMVVIQKYAAKLIP